MSKHSDSSISSIIKLQEGPVNENINAHVSPIKIATPPPKFPPLPIAMQQDHQINYERQPSTSYTLDPHPAPYTYNIQPNINYPTPLPPQPSSTANPPRNYHYTLFNEAIDILYSFSIGLFNNEVDLLNAVNRYNELRNHNVGSSTSIDSAWAEIERKLLSVTQPLLNLSNVQQRGAGTLPFTIVSEGERKKNRFK